jgi:hypothetical protein
VVGVVEYSHGGGASCRSGRICEARGNNERRLINPPARPRSRPRTRSPNHPVCSWILPIRSNLTAGSFPAVTCFLKIEFDGGSFAVVGVVRVSRVERVVG